MRQLSCWLPAALIGICSLIPPAAAQGIVGDVLSGKLIDPETGVYALYDLHDVSTGRRFMLRQAIVGEEKVGRAAGYWIELEIIPELGYPVIYKTLVTGPANDPSNIHRIIMQEGDDSPVEVPVPKAADEDGETAPAVRESVGTEQVETPAGAIEAERFVLADPAAPDAKTEVWINDDVRPMGIVRMVSPHGELRLVRFGKGGPDAVSAISKAPVAADAPEARPQTSISVRVEGGLPESESAPEPEPTP
jgi:hypothetical protein